MGRARQLLVGFAVGCADPRELAVDDTDAFAPDAPTAVVRTTHNGEDLKGTWEVRVPDVLQRKVEVLRAGIDGSSPDAFDPPLSEAERVWYDQARDRDHPYRAWYRCSQQCRFEITDGAVWNYGYYPFSPVGSGLMRRPDIRGRDVELSLQEHDPAGLSGRIALRMNREWTAFRVIAFELEGFRDPHLGQKLELYYERVED